MTLRQVNNQIDQLKTNMSQLNVTITEIKANLTRLEAACACPSVKFNISSLFVLFDVSKVKNASMSFHLQFICVDIF